MQCFWGCKIVWESEFKKQDMQRCGYLHEPRIEFVVMVQWGKCSKCGKIYRRKIDYI